MTLENILDLARKRGAQQAEAFALETEETPVIFETNRLKEIYTRQTKGAALRVIKDGRIGFAASSKPNDVEGLMEAALEAAPFGPEAKFDFPVEDRFPAVDVFDPTVEKVGVEEMVQLGQTLIDSVRQEENELLCEGSVGKSLLNMSCLNSSGGQFAYSRTQFSLAAHGTLVRGTDMLFVGDWAHSCQAIGDWEPLAESIRRQLRYAKTNAKASTGQLPVIFTPLGVASALAMPLTLAFSGRLIYQGQSPLVGRLGKQMYDRRLTLYDDATIPYRPPSRICDDEGVPSRRLSLVEDGVVSGFLYDLQTAGLAGASSTGSGCRSLTTPPAISTSCLVIGAGEATIDDMVADVQEGLLVEQLMGAGQGNVLGGDFAGNVLLGYKIENGEIIGRVKDTMVAGNVHQASKELAAIGKEARWVGGGLSTPALYFPSLSVSAKS